MKSLLVIVAVFIVAFEADSRDIPNGEGNQDSYIEMQGFVGGPVEQDLALPDYEGTDAPLSSNGVTEGKNPSDVDRQLNQVLEEDLDAKLRGKGKTLKEILKKVESVENYVESIKDNEGFGCPSGFIWDVTHSQCFKFYNDTGRSWNASFAWCQSQGLQMAKPIDPIYIRQYLVTEYGLGSKNWAWIGASGNGSSFIWQQDGQILSRYSRFWYRGQPGTPSVGRFPTLMTREDQMKRYPYQPYYTQTKSVTSFWTLCELVMDKA